MNCVTSMPFSQTSQPRPQAPSVGFSQSSSTKRTSFFFRSKPSASQRAEVELEDVGRRGLEHHLVLVVVLQPVRVLAVAAVLGAAARLHVGGLPRLGAEGAQEGRGVAGAGADLHVVGLQQRAALLGPVRLQAQDDLLEREHRALESVVDGAARRCRAADRTILGAARDARRPQQAATSARAPSSGQSPRRPAQRANGVRPLPALDRALEHAARERRQRVRDDAAVVDDRRWRRCWWRGSSAAANSSARMREICRCWSIAIVLPNQPMLLRLARIVGAVARAAKRAAELLAEQVLVADVGRDALAADGERRRGQRRRG